MSLLSLNSFKTLSLLFCASFPSNLKNPILLLLKGISKRSKNPVHWLKMMLFSPVFLMLSRHWRSFMIFDDSFQFLSTSTWKRLSVGHVIRSALVRGFRHIGQGPPDGVLQLDRRHSLHIRWAHGVSTGSSDADSRQIGHSVTSPRRMPSTTSSTKARVGAAEGVGFVPSRKRRASLFRSAYC